MFLQDFETKESKFGKMQRYLKENHGYELDMSAMDATKVADIITSTTNKMKVTEDSTEYTRLHMIAESLKLWTPAPVQTELTDMVAEAVDDDGVEQAKVILAAQEMNDELQKMVERVAEMQVQDLIPLVDAMKAELGMEQAEAFNNAADTALGGLLDTVKSTKEAVENAILGAQGQAPAVDMEMPAADIGAGDVDMTGMDADAPDDDAFGGDDASADADGEPEGRELKAESADVFDTMLEELQSKVNENGEVSRADLEGALAQFRAK
jgi:regulator of PEP synthase PpsR (kinase-PPPase family)